MLRYGLRFWGTVCSVGIAVAVWNTPAHSVPLDKDGDIKLGVRTYVNARVGTENTHQGNLLINPDGSTSDQQTSGTWPNSNAGHLRQNRYFIEAELKHDLDGLVKRGVGPFGLLNDLPFKITDLSYDLTFRGEADSLYDWGPREYSTAQENYKLQYAAPPNVLVSKAGQQVHNVQWERARLRRLGTQRERLFQAFIEGKAGDLFVRFGRQIMSWGETDGFQLLDHINPLDSSFGGFMISLDERRVPLDMLRTQYYLGEYGPFSEMYLEAYAAMDNSFGDYPGTPAGSPWNAVSLGAPSISNHNYNTRPPRNFSSNTRGGGRFVFNALDATFSIAHYYTHFDTPTLQAYTSGYKANADGTDNNRKTLLNAFNDGQLCADGSYTCGTPVHTWHRAPMVQVTGASATFALPSIYSVVRAEGAYFRGEPSFTQYSLDPFLFNIPGTGPIPAARRQTGGEITRDSINAVIGIDRNQWIRWLNPNQTFFISTQLFFKHLQGTNDGPIYLGKDARGNLIVNPYREVLPPSPTVINYYQPSDGSNLGRSEPIYVTQPQTQFLQTFFMGTSFMSGQVNPGFTMFYDWGGAFVYQPGVTLLHDPFRLTIDYTILDAHSYKGGSGVSLMKDRDNIQFRFEYVI